MSIRILGDGGGGGAARQAYLSNVYPIMQAKCAGCHSTTAANATPFVGASAANAYEAIVGFTSVVGNFTETGAAMYTKVIAAGGHQGKTYSADEQTKIKAWLAAEVTERNGGPGPGPGPGPETPAQATARLISEWSGCLKLEDFTGKTGESLRVSVSGIGAKNVLLVGLGEGTFGEKILVVGVVVVGHDDDTVASVDDLVLLVETAGA